MNRWSAVVVTLSACGLLACGVSLEPADLATTPGTGGTSQVQHALLCGDRICEDAERWSCPLDCEGQEEPPEETDPVCGNGVCELGETPTVCPQDCPCFGTTPGTPNPLGYCGDGYCDFGEWGRCAPDCDGREDPPEETDPVCGNGRCEWGESHATCPADCGC
ncbi:hypothetical protein LZ198_01195 [Myxococcus sp. K15C18031901]|uniref:hypothetical protein n=1 Tax=Myxococcus dinghuensis TaxID=2906761 RepID=UPI0020A8094C|nr:hypothetical protein [Myxococcus dinghuensis]MCP3097483.1 hypothetical protein [Myxococcus dinghuensis]